MRLTQEHIGKRVRWYEWPENVYMVLDRIDRGELFGTPVNLPSPYGTRNQWFNMEGWKLCDEQAKPIYRIKPVTGKRKVAV